MPGDYVLLFSAEKIKQLFFYYGDHRKSQTTTSNTQHPRPRVLLCISIVRGESQNKTKRDHELYLTLCRRRNQV